MDVNAAPPVFAESPREVRQYKYFDKLVSAFVAVLLVSNLVAPKMISAGPFLFSAAQLLFPITYIFGDVFTEVYGYAYSRKAIWNGFFAAALLAGLSAIVIALPPAPEWHDQAAFVTVLGMAPRVFAASLIAYWAGEFANSYVMAKMKIVTDGKYLWTRTLGSTAVGQAVDSVIVMIIVFAGRASWGDIVKLIYSGYLAKLLYEAAATPLTYMVVNLLKRREGVDPLDVGTDFNPFAAGR
jgi:queuosine precursor transporter